MVNPKDVCHLSIKISPFSVSQNEFPQQIRVQIGTVREIVRIVSLSQIRPVLHWASDCRIGIKDGHPHRFRDTAAVELLKAGVDIREVQKFLGHKSLATTEKYYAPWNKRQQDIFGAKIKAAQQTMELHV